MFSPVYLVRDGGAPQAVDARSVDYAVVDVETTGLDPARGHRVCEVAVMRMRSDGSVLEEFSTLVNPQRASTREARDVHGISDAETAGAPLFSEIAGTVLRLMSGAVVVAHNMPFERAFLQAEFARLGLDSLRAPGLCTKVAFRCQSEFLGYKLMGVVKSLSGEWPWVNHSALADARSTAASLATLLMSAPDRLRLTSVSTPPLPTLPEARRMRPRGFGWGKRGALQAYLPFSSRIAPDPEGTREYERLLADVIARGQFTNAIIDELAEAVPAAGYDQQSLLAAHRDVWRTARAADPEPLTDSLSRTYRMLAERLRVPELAAELPRIRDELRHVRLATVGDDPSVTALTGWATRYGASVYKTLSPSVTMVVTADPERAARRKPVQEHRLVVRTPREAEAELRRLIEAAPVRAQVSPPPASTSLNLVFPSPLTVESWRTRELPYELCDGEFVRPVRQLAEHAANPSVSWVHFSRTPQPTLVIDHRRVPESSRWDVDDALHYLPKEPQLKVRHEGRRQR